MKTIYLLSTGGTIEEVYSEHAGNIANVSSKIDRYLRLLRLPNAEINIVSLMNKVSLEMTGADRLLLLGMVRAILKENAPMLITHGTDAMVETGLYLQRALSKVGALRGTTLRLALPRAGRSQILRMFEEMVASESASYTRPTTKRLTHHASPGQITGKGMLYRLKVRSHIERQPSSRSDQSRSD